jgi:allantoicase
VTHVRLEALPDGGLSRLRVIATPDAVGRRALGITFWNTLPATQLSGILTASGVPVPTADALVRQRPLKANAVPLDSAMPGSAAVNALLFGKAG